MIEVPLTQGKVALIDDEDFDLHQHLVSLSGPPAKPGRYRARLVDERWTWEEVEQP